MMKYIPIFQGEVQGSAFEAPNIDMALEYAEEHFVGLIAVERYCGKNGGWR